MRTEAVHSSMLGASQLGLGCSGRAVRERRVVGMNREAATRRARGVGGHGGAALCWKDRRICSDGSARVVGPRIRRAPHRRRVARRVLVLRARVSQ